MNIENFLNLIVGRWFAQRTSYVLDKEEVENSKADITIQALNKDDQEVIKLCKENNIKAQKTLGGIKSSWDTSVDWGKTKEQGFSLLVFVPDEDNLEKGLLLRNLGVGKNNISHGSYILTQDEVLTLFTQEKDCIIEERQWFASDNLKLRNVVVNIGEDCKQTTFYSEIRKIVTPPKE